MNLSSIYVYPVKSLGGIKLLSSEVEARGLKYDRRWMIVDRENQFVTQRTHPRLSLINVFRDGEIFILEYRGGKADVCALPLEYTSGTKNSVVIWDDKTEAYIYDEESSRWISDILGGDFRFVYMSGKEKRIVKNSNEHIVSFADAYPFLITGQSSLDDLNSRMIEKIEMIRFRPNFVFTGGEPYEEDHWMEFSIGDITFFGAKPCSRCTIPTINPASGERSAEPTKTLAGYRRWNNNIYFGMNLLCREKTGSVTTGDSITVKKRHKTLWKDKINE